MNNRSPSLYLTLGGHGDDRFVAVHANPGQGPLRPETLAAQPALTARWNRENPGISPGEALALKADRRAAARARGTDPDPGRERGPFGI